MKTLRGRPKGQSIESRSFGLMGDLIRSNRLKLGLGLLDVAKACHCSVQFISNVEHGRAPLPWTKISTISSLLKISSQELSQINLRTRSLFKSVQNSSSRISKKSQSLQIVTQTASRLALLESDTQLQKVLTRYMNSSASQQKKISEKAFELLVS